MNATDVSTAWCGACSLTTDQSPCPRCGAPVDGPVADELRRVSLGHQDALVHGRLDEARSFAHRHEALRAAATTPARPSFAPHTTEPPVSSGAGGAEGGGIWSPMPAPERRPPVDPSRIITWAGAAMLIAGALAFAGVIWQYAGGMGRMGILALVTFAAAVGADRLRRRAPVTAEALTAVFAAMIVVDTIAAAAARYVDRDHTSAWTTATSTTAAVLFVVLARHWRSTTARLCGVGFAVLAGASAAVWLTGLQTGLSALHAWQVLLGAGVLTAAAFASRALPRGTERAALLGATGSAWTIFTAACVADVTFVLGASWWPGVEPSLVGSSFLPALSLLALVAPPLVVRLQEVATALIAGAAAGAVLLVAVAQTAATVPYAVAAPVAAAAVVGALLVVAVVVPVALVLVMPRRDPSRAGLASWPDQAAAARAAALAVVSSLTVAGGTMWQALQVRDDAGSSTAALVVILPAVAVAITTFVLADRVHGDLETTLGVSSLALGLSALTLVTTDTVALSTGSVLAIAAGVLAAVSFVVRRRARWWALEVAALGALSVSLVLGVDEVELWSIPAALVALTLGIAVRRTDDSVPSWLTVTPAAVLALVPSLVVGLAGGHQGLRLTVVSALATLVLLEGARRRLKGPTAVAVATLATVLLWMIAPHVHQAPSWVVLVTCGAAMLWVGFTWEARRDSAKHAWQRWAEWQ